MSFSTIQQELFGIWRSPLCLFIYNLNTAKMSQKWGLWCTDLPSGKLRERDNCVDLKLRAWNLTDQSAVAGITAVTASFLERVWVSVAQTDAESKRSVFNAVCPVLTKWQKEEPSTEISTINCMIIFLQGVLNCLAVTSSQCLCLHCCQKSTVFLLTSWAMDPLRALMTWRHKLSYDYSFLNNKIILGYLPCQPVWQ